MEEEAVTHPGVSWGISAWKDATNSSRDTRPSWQMSRRRIQAKMLFFFKVEFSKATYQRAREVAVGAAIALMNAI